MRVLLVVVLLLLGVLPAGAEGTRGGGHAIRCVGATPPFEDKLYAWDYVNAQMSGMPVDPAFLQAKSAKEILNTIADRLDKVRPKMASSLRGFLIFNEDPLSMSTSRVWLRGTNPLVPIGDEDRVRIPKHCIANATKDFRLYQAVIRTQPGEKIFYAYDQALINELEANHPMQLSFLYLHEWLRDYTQNATTLTLVNQLLHGTEWTKQNCKNLGKALKGMGLEIPDDNMACNNYNGTYSGPYERGPQCYLVAKITLVKDILTISESCEGRYKLKFTDVYKFRCKRGFDICPLIKKSGDKRELFAVLKPGSGIDIVSPPQNMIWSYEKR